MHTTQKWIFGLITSSVFALGVPSAAHAEGAAKEVYENVRSVVREMTGGERRVYDDGVFTQREREAILRGVIYGDRDDDDHSDKKGKKQKDLPPGLQKKAAKGKQLPPGWQKKVARGEVIGSDVYRYRQALPRKVLTDIRTLPGTAVIQLDEKVVRVLEDTRTVIDVIDLIQGR